MELLGDPQEAYPSVHITGTNGKGSTAAMVTALLGARGLTVGTYTSPNLQTGERADLPATASPSTTSPSSRCSSRWPGSSR